MLCTTHLHAMGSNHMKKSLIWRAVVDKKKNKDYSMTDGLTI